MQIVGPCASYTDRYHLSYQSHKITLEVNSHLCGKLAGSMFSHVRSIEKFVLVPCFVFIYFQTCCILFLTLYGL